ncbi:MAG: tetratricopeptide repeat protein, partial [Candidatus Melainabacteria bacterium]|nr:tetratricopeptide repeat protein [Candidatus Melainabacteria bacterium]
MASGLVVVRVPACMALSLKVLCLALALSWCSQLTGAQQNPDKDSPTMPTDSPANNTSTQAASSNQSVSPSQADNKPYSDDAVRHYNRGVELHQSGFLNQAISEYKAAIDADNRMEEAYSNLGLIYAAQRNYSKAIEAFNKALSLKPARPTTLNGLGTVLYAKGRLSEAMEKWKQAIAIDPQFASAYFNMGNALENEKNFQSAVDAYLKATKINPGMADAYYRIGTIFNKDKHLAQASVLLSRAIELSPDADFAHDAKKQLAQLESEFAHSETEDPDVKMNIMPPPTATDA